MKVEISRCLKEYMLGPAAFRGNLHVCLFVFVFLFVSVVFFFTCLALERASGWKILRKLQHLQLLLLINVAVGMSRRAEERWPDVQMLQFKSSWWLLLPNFYFYTRVSLISFTSVAACLQNVINVVTFVVLLAGWRDDDDDKETFATFCLSINRRL